MQTATTILMVRPANFGFNPETADNNFYQHPDTRSSTEINTLAQKEFDDFVSMLRDQGINVLVEEDTFAPAKPDAIFPNNWFSTHPDGKLILYPMYSPNRRLERRKDLIENLIKRRFTVEEIIDLSFFEDDDQYLEGTGSMVMDHQSKTIFACYSERTHPIPLDYLGKLIGYKVVGFHATQEIHGVSTPIYHTNVMMHIGTDLSVVCLDSISKASEKQNLQKCLTQAGKKVVPITPKQKFHFAGNMLEVGNDGGEKFTVMSETALDSLNIGQIQLIEKYSTIISPSIPTIEKLGGGSARCMMAEIFLQATK
ncbi:citrulline utilization hydrolase CtlX [Algoriphagus sp. Y33]|uniref:citrulline utilization hydrolase CtlX n=1 Tax=Algoriphagus sp. Y33 TaxID=2772483 RepID=UPI001CE13A7D|nr:arginine deiminase-related protein [Algoriphagus sp. Y33]